MFELIKTTKICKGKNSCNQQKPITEFYLYHGKYKNNCKKCLSSYQSSRNYQSLRKNNFDLTKYNREYAANVRLKKPIERILTKLRCRNYSYLKQNNIKKSRKIKDSIGCSPHFLQHWLEYTKMIDDLKGKLHIDHFFALSRFECATIEDVEKCNMNHWTNLRYSTKKFNLEKHNRLPTTEETKRHNQDMIDFIIIYNRHYR